MFIGLKSLFVVEKLTSHRIIDYCIYFSLKLSLRSTFVGAGLLVRDGSQESSQNMNKFQVTMSFLMTPR